MAAGDLKSVYAIYFKAALFLLLGLLCVIVLVALHGSWQFVCLLGIAIWSFCRAYYFAFYVIEHYVDSSFRFAGLIDFFRYLLGSKR
jgi:hypothetical protein